MHFRIIRNVENFSYHVSYINFHTCISVALALSPASTLRRCDVEASLTTMYLSSLFLFSDLEPAKANIGKWYIISKASYKLGQLISFTLTSSRNLFVDSLIALLVFQERYTIIGPNNNRRTIFMIGHAYAVWISFISSNTEN